MKILLIYATYSSGTQLASEIAETKLQSHNHEVERKNVKDVHPEELDQFELVILASPSWLNRKHDGMPHEFMLTFMDQMEGKKMKSKKFAVFGLGDTAYPNFCGAVTKLEEFVQKLEGEMIVPSLRIDGYFFNQIENEKKLEEWVDGLASKIA